MGHTRYLPRPAMATKLYPFRGIIEARLREFPKQSAQRPFDEIRAAGYAGGYGHVRDHVHGPAAGAAESGPALRDGGGRQPPADFGRFVLPWGRR